MFSFNITPFLCHNVFANVLEMRLKEILVIHWLRKETNARGPSPADAPLKGKIGTRERTGKRPPQQREKYANVMYMQK